MKKNPMVQVTAALYLALAVAACDLGGTISGNLGDGAPAADGIPTAPAPVQEDVVASECGPPIRVVNLQDKTGSATTNRTPQITVAALEPLLARIAACGGELALGILASSSNEPLLRVFVPPPPAPPTNTQTAGNPYQVSIGRHGKAEAQQRYEGALRRHQAAVADEVASFRQSASELLARRPDASRSDVLGAVTRSAHFLGEPWQGQASLYAIIISDGKDNVGAAVRPLPEGSALLLVNGDPVLGSLSGMTNARFESFDAAVRFILNRR